MHIIVYVKIYTINRFWLIKFFLCNKHNETKIIISLFLHVFYMLELMMLRLLPNMGSGIRSL